jgi:hypothetical protein
MTDAYPLQRRAGPAALLLCLALLSPGAAAGDQPALETLRWGRYLVQFFHEEREGQADRVRIRGPDGRLLVEVRAEGILPPSRLQDPAQPMLRDLNGDGVAELRLLAWSGGAYCCYTELLFERRGGLRNLLIYRGQEYHLYKGRAALNEPLRRAGQAGPPLLVVENDAIQHLNGATHGPTTVLVLARAGDRYLDATRRYPEFARSRAREYRARLAIAADGPDALSDADYEDALTGYYANALLAGEAEAARRWLLAQGRRELVEPWLRERAPRIPGLLQDGACRIGRSQLGRIDLIRGPGPCAGRRAGQAK